MAASIKFLSEDSDPENDDSSHTLLEKKDVCSLCAEQESRYTCPRCNIRYCSVACYKSEKHQGCSEAFYKECVLDELKEQTASPEDRQKILEMLQREQEQFTEDADEAEGEEDETPSLSERMEGLDLDKDSAEVWRRLTKDEKEEFATMMKDGRLSNLVTIWTPWWITKGSSRLVQEGSGDSLPAGFPPHLSDVPDINTILKSKPSSDIKHNLINVISAYAFVTRLHNGDHHHHAVECTEELVKVSGVLTNNENYPGAKEAVHSVIQQVQQAGSGFVVPPSFPIVLLGDVMRILRGSRLSPLSAVLSALSDVVSLLKEANKDLKKDGKRKKKKPANPSPDESTDKEPSVEKQVFLAKKKVLFLLSWAQRYGMCLAPLCAELDLELECLKSEAKDTKSLQKQVEEGLQAGKLQPPTETPKVEELS